MNRLPNLRRLDQEIHGSVEQVAGLQREYLEALDVLQKEQIDGCNKVESGGSRSKAHRGVAPDEPMQQEDGKRLGSSHTWAEYQTSEPHSRAELTNVRGSGGTVRSLHAGKVEVHAQMVRRT